MISELEISKMKQRKNESLSKFIKRQGMAKATIKRINTFERHLGHLLADDEEPRENKRA